MRNDPKWDGMGWDRIWMKCITSTIYETQHLRCILATASAETSEHCDSQEYTLTTITQHAVSDREMISIHTRKQNDHFEIHPLIHSFIHSSIPGPSAMLCFATHDFARSLELVKSAYAHQTYLLMAPAHPS